MKAASLIATAKAMAPHVVAWVAEDEPIGYLTVNRTKRELIALVAVLAEVVAHCKDGGEILAEVCAARDEGEDPRKGWARSGRPDDGIVDDHAVWLAVTGGRPVSLSPPEQVRAAQMVMAEGEGAWGVRGRLGVGYPVAVKLVAEAQGGDEGAAA